MNLTTSISNPGPEDWFTGQTWMEHLGTLPTPTPTRVLGREGEPVIEAHSGHSVEFPLGERHWHGAAPGRVMTHLAVQATDPDTERETRWQEHVNDESYDALG
jgi:hypothetical protein